VRFSELDTNQHANSASYVDWCLEAVPMPILDRFLPDSFQITFKKECRLGEELAARSESLQELEPGVRSFRHGLWRLSDETLLAIATSRWKSAA
jgi:acyl-ACP thioesterase